MSLRHSGCGRAGDPHALVGCAITTDTPLVSQVAIDLLQQLLERNPTKRLCDPEKIKAHPYFSAIDWEKLEKKELPPPYVPPVVRCKASPLFRTWHGNTRSCIQRDATSVSMIDPVFTNEEVAVSPSGAMDQEMTRQAHIADFTYVAPSAIPGASSQLH